MRFLGEHQDMPFFMVQAGKHLFTTKESGRDSRTRRLLLAVPLPKTEGSFESEDSDTSLSTLATFTTANDGDSMVVDSIERGEKHGENTNPDLTPAKRSSSGGHIRCATSPTTVTVGRASSFMTKSVNKTPSTQGSHFSSSTIPRQLTRGSVPLALASTQSALVPRAITLTIYLSKESFAPSCGTKSKHAPQDVKIDVFFNGEMTASTYIPARYRGEASNMIHLTQHFSGRRVDRMAERPWVIVPPGQNADGSLRTSKRNKGAYVGAQERWDRIGKALDEEGEKFGRNRYGDPSVVGEYLTSLSKLEMPAEVDDMQKGGGPKFGVIDVILTLGKGQKDEPESGYLKEPTRMRLSGFHINDLKKAEEMSMENRVTEPIRSHVEANSLNLFATANTQFATPHIPSAAPFAIRRRQSFNTADQNPASSLSAKTKRGPEVPQVSDKNGTAMQVHSSTLRDASRRGVDVSLVPAGTPMPKFTGQRRLDLPSHLAKTPSCSVPVPVGRRARVAIMSRSQELRTAMAMEVDDTRASQHKELQPRQSHTPDLSQSGFISDSSVISPTHSSPSTLFRPRRGADHKLIEDASISTRRSRYGGLQGAPSELELSRDLITATDGTRSPSGRSRRQENVRNSIDSTLPSTSKVPLKRYKHSLSRTSENSNPQGRQYPSGWAISDKPTLAEEIEQIEASSRKEITTRADNADQKANTTPSNGKQVSARQILKLKLKEPVVAQKTYSSTATSAAASTRQTPAHTVPRRPRTASNRTAQSTASIKRTSKPAPSPTPQAPRRRRRSTASTPLAASRLPVFPTPALSQDSVLSYAEGTAWKTGLGHVNGAAGVESGVYRQIRAERNGWFEESGVLMGVRFLVG